MKTYAAVFTFVQDIMERRTPHREAHVKHVTGLRDAGRVIMAGPWENYDGALIIFRAEDREDVEQMIHDDSYYKAGLWPQIDIHEWSVFMSSDAAYEQATNGCPGNTK